MASINGATFKGKTHFKFKFTSDFFQNAQFKDKFVEKPEIYLKYDCFTTFWGVSPPRQVFDNS